jgi:uncharacterized protein (DUF362 family)
MARYHAAVVNCDSYSRLDEAFSELKEKAGLAGFESKLKGKKVLVKPNMLGLYKPEQAVSTHPALVRTVVRWLRQAGATVSVGDNCGLSGYGLNQRAAKITGIEEASEGAYINIARDVIEKPVESRFFDNLIVSKPILEADLVVNLPKLKTHTLSLLTLGVKNMFGILAGGSKARSHNSAQRVEEFGEALSDIFRIRPPELTIIDGIVGMDGNGPTQMGRIRNFGMLIASENACAADLAVVKMAGIDPKMVHHLNSCAERGLGPKNFSDLEIGGNWKPIRKFKLPNTIVASGLIGFFTNRYIHGGIISSKLVLNKQKCNSDRLCVGACPSGAMSWKFDYPEIDYGKCIRCMCCFELCPEGAWNVQGLLGRVVGK